MNEHGVSMEEHATKERAKIERLITLCSVGDMTSTMKLREKARKLGIQNANTMNKRGLCQMFAVLHGVDPLKIAIHLPSPPHELVEPVTHDVFNDPWVNDSGHTYNHSTIDKLPLYKDEKEQLTYRRDPQTRHRIHNWAPNYAFNGLLRSWKGDSGFYEEECVTHNDIPEWKPSVDEDPRLKDWIRHQKDRIQPEVPQAPRTTIVEIAKPLRRHHMNVVITMSLDWRVHEEYSKTFDSIVVKQYTNGILRKHHTFPLSTTFHHDLFLYNDFNDDVRNDPIILISRKTAWEMAQNGVFSQHDYYIVFYDASCRRTRQTSIQLYSDMFSLPSVRPRNVFVGSDINPDGTQWRRQCFCDIVILLPENHEQRELFIYDHGVRDIYIRRYHDHVMVHSDKAPSLTAARIWFERNSYNTEIQPTEEHHSIREQILLSYQIHNDHTIIETTVINQRG